jgi:hypothetical protein
MLPFADLEVVANAAVLNQLANVQVVIDGQMVPGIFRRPSAVANLGIGAADTTPTLTIASSAVPDGPVEKVIAIAGVPYVILADAPDGTGLTVLTVGAYQ